MGDKTNEKSLQGDEAKEKIAKSALADFTAGDYAASLANLQILETTGGQDYKLAHNKAVVKYYLTGLNGTEQFKKSLDAVRNQPCYSSEECQGLDDVEHCALYYNQAVVLFHMRKYNLALNIMKKAFTFIEPMEESLAHKVCLLLVELLLCLRRVEEALECIEYVLIQFASTKNIQILEEPAEKKPVIFDAATDAFRRKLLNYKARCFLLCGHVPGAAKELPALDNLPTPLDHATLFLLAHTEYLRGSPEKAVELLNMANSIPGPPFVQAGVSIPFLFNNNMGCVQYKLGKPNLAAFYFKRSLLENEEMIRLSRAAGRPLYTMGGNSTAQLMYNIGVSQLFAKHAVQAFDFLLQAVQVFHLNPRLWLRMAECCIMVHKEGNEEEFAMSGRRKELVAAVFGSGAHRKLLLLNQSNPPGSGGAGEPSAAIPAPTLEFAALCLKNALLLLPPGVEGERKDSWISPPITPTHSTKESAARCSMYGAPSSLLSDSEVQAIRVSSLAASSYVSLCLGDYTLALQYAETLLKEQRVPGAHRTLAHLYAAEALLMLDRVQEAIEHLNPEHVIDLDVSLPPPGFDSPNHSSAKKDWYPDKPLTGKIVMQVNMAMAFAIKGDLNKSGELLKLVWALKTKVDIPLQIVMLALYIELQLGHTDNARSILKQYCPTLR